MMVGDEVEVDKPADDNHGRAGHVARLPEPGKVDVAFEGGMEKATYTPDELKPVKPVIPRGMQSEVRGFWETRAQYLKAAIFYQATTSFVRDAVLTVGTPEEMREALGWWLEKNERCNAILRELIEGLGE